MVRISRKLNKITLSDQQLEEMAAYMKGQEDVLAFYLYGSYGQEHQTHLSDVDLAVLPFPSKSLDFKREIELLVELQDIGKSDDINLVNLMTVPVTLQMRVLDEGRQLYCRDETLLADFKEYVILRYGDFLPHLLDFYRDFDAGLREELL